MTIADKIAARLNNDGQRYTADDGRDFPALCEAENATVDQNWKRECTRYTFADGSVLTEQNGVWDFGYADCHCWQGAYMDEGHHDQDCRERGEDE